MKLVNLQKLCAFRSVMPLSQVIHFNIVCTSQIQNLFRDQTDVVHACVEPEIHNSVLLCALHLNPNCGLYIHANVHVHKLCACIKVNNNNYMS